MDYRSDYGMTPYISAIKGIRDKWLWFFILGILLIVLGLVVVHHAYFATVFSVVLLGALLMSGGVVQIVESFWAHKWSGVLGALLVGLLYLVAGYLCIARPAAAAIGLTLFIASMLIVIGLFRMILSAWYRYDQWGWGFISGLITLALGIMIYAEWPVSAIWVIGLFLGIDMIMSGITWVLLSLKARKV